VSDTGFIWGDGYIYSPWSLINPDCMSCLLWYDHYISTLNQALQWHLFLDVKVSLQNNRPSTTRCKAERPSSRGSSFFEFWPEVLVLDKSVQQKGGAWVGLWTNSPLSPLLTTCPIVLENGHIPPRWLDPPDQYNSRLSRNSQEAGINEFRNPAFTLL
jgi:hypothetical protein